MSLLWRAQLLLLSPVLLYIAFLGLLTVPSIQRTLLYAHIARVPSLSGQTPEAFGFGPGQLRDVRVRTPDGVELGAWHVLPHDLYVQHTQEHGIGAAIPPEFYDQALHQRPAILYAHAMAQNFVIFDYRGFADSSRHLPPSEKGLLTDARAMWDWLVVDKGVKPAQITLWGQSLGTGVVSGLAARLADQGISPRALILVAPFTSLPHLLETYKLATIIPLLGPLTSIPGAHKLLLRFLRAHFDTRIVLPKVKSPIMLIHAMNDRDISPSHSQTLFADLTAGQTVIESNLSDGSAGRVRTAGRVTLVEPAYGGHNAVGYSETALLFIRQLISNPGVHDDAK